MECFDLPFSHFKGVSPDIALLVKADELIDPAKVTLLGINGVMQES